MKLVPVLSLAALLTAATAASADACPFCKAVSLTMSEQMDQKEVVVLTQWVEGEKPTAELAGNTTFEVIEVTKAGKLAVEKKAKITVTPYQAGQPGDMFLLMGSQNSERTDWSSPPIEVTETSYQYIKQSPSLETSKTERLAYFMKFLEFPDTLVANDAYSEFAIAAYEDLVPLAPQMPRERLRKWISNPNVDVSKLGLYGLMLGLCGTEEDAKFLENKILEENQSFRLGIDGIMAGYLLLTGEQGLKTLEDTKIKPHWQTDKEGKVVLNDQGEKMEFPFSETYAAMQAIRFMWTYGNGKISKDEIRESMRLLLDRPAVVDLVIPDLARWEDWTVMDRLMTMYDDEEFNIKSVKKAIIRYMFVAAKQKKEGSEELTAEAKQAEAHLKTLEAKDEELYVQSIRFLFIN